MDPYSDPDLLAILDPDPYPDLMNPNPQHCFLNLMVLSVAVLRRLADSPVRALPRPEHCC